MKQDYTPVLRSLMQQANIPSFRALARQARVSDWQVRQLRWGKVEHMRLTPLLSLSKCLGMEVMDLVTSCSAIATSSPPINDLINLTDLTDELEDAHASPSTEVHPPQSSLGQGGSSGPLPDHSRSVSEGRRDARGVNGISPRDSTEELQRLKQEYQRLQHRLEQQKEDLHHHFQRTSLQMLESWMMYWPAAVYAAQKNPGLPATRLIPLVRPVEKLLSTWGVAAIAAVGAEVAYDLQQHQLVEGLAEPGDLVRISNPGYTHAGALLHRAKVKAINQRK